MHAASAFTALAGGMLIGVAASGLLFLNGRIAGISGIVSGLLPPWREDVAWRASFVSGLVAGGLAVSLVHPGAFDVRPPPSLAILVVAGLLVGVGTRIGNGCTSGHGVCGLARRSSRSLAATVVFIATGAFTVYVVRHLKHGF